MAKAPLRALLQHLRRIVGPGDGGLADARLLERFVNERDEAAFEVLVWRHGPMVLNVCRRVLRQEQDAEDAFQATFLMFVRKARSIGNRQAVAGWLYKVAFRIALEAKKVASKGSVRDTAALTAGATKESADDAAWRDVRAVLDEEVSRLPYKYRMPVVLCYFEGKTYEEAARELGCPKGTLSIRLMRARELLRPRLTRRGLALSGGMLAAVMSESAPAAALLKSLVQSTIKAALLFAAAKPAAGVVSAQAVALMEGVLKTMFVTKVKIAAAVFLAMGVIGSGAGVLTYRGLAGEQGKLAAEKNTTPRPQGAEAEVGKVSSPVPRNQDEDQKKRMQREARIALERLHETEGQYIARERNWSEELIQARVRLTRAQEWLRMNEQEQDAERLALYSLLKDYQKNLKRAELNPASQDVIKGLQNAVHSIRDKWVEMESRAQNSGSSLYQARMQFVKADEELRVLERLQAFERDKLLRRVEAEEDRVRKLQQDPSRAPPATQTSAELERKVERLLRDVAEIRLQIQRQSTDKSQPRSSERRPDQP